MGILDGRKAIIIGASSGVGYGVALRFAEEGADIIAGARRMDRLQNLVQEAKDRGFAGEITPVVCDVEKEEDLDNIVKTCVDKYGRIDILAPISQGGLYDQHNVEGTSADNLMLFFRTGPVYSLQMVQKCLPYFKEQHYGRILMCASGAGIQYTENCCAYGQAKAAIINLARSCAHELGQYGVVTNCFLPVAKTESFTDPDSPGGKKYLAMMEQAIPTHHFGTAYEDVSPLLAFLASEQASYVNGQVISICGGCCNPY